MPQVQIRFAPVKSHHNVSAPIIGVKRVLCPISRLRFLKQYIGDHTYLVSYWVIRFSKTSVVAYWLWRRASDPWVIGSSPGGCKYFFGENNEFSPVKDLKSDSTKDRTLI